MTRFAKATASIMAVAFLLGFTEKGPLAGAWLAWIALCVCLIIREVTQIFAERNERNERK